MRVAYRFESYPGESAVDRQGQMKKRVQNDTVPVMTNRKALRAKVYWVTHGIQKTVDASVMLGYSQLDIERMIALWVSNNKESGKGNSED